MPGNTTYPRLLVKSLIQAIEAAIPTIIASPVLIITPPILIYRQTLVVPKLKGGHTSSHYYVSSNP